ncbi:MAG: hypothetical protein KAY50_02210 [Chitinophagaceae bacterium]|nr:hypothetical protein [Chitinophagaceae bacterium]
MLQGWLDIGAIGHFIPVVLHLGWTFNLGLLFVNFSFYIFNKQRFRADSTTIPALQQALLVSSKHMKTSTLTTILTILLSVILFFTGIYFYGQYLEWTLPNIDGMKFQVTSVNGQFYGMLTFALTIALIPVSAFVTWKFAPIVITNRKLLNILILLVCVIIGAVVRREWLIFQSNRNLKGLSQGFDNKFQFQIPVENFNVTNYMLLGLLIGTAISYFLLKQTIATK